MTDLFGDLAAATNVAHIKLGVGGGLEHQELGSTRNEGRSDLPARK